MEQETSSATKEEKNDESRQEEGGGEGPNEGREGGGRFARGGESGREAGSSGLRRSVASYSSSSCLTQPAMVQHVDFVTVHSQQESDDNSSSSSSSSSSRPSSILSVDSSMPSAASSPLISSRRPGLVVSFTFLFEFSVDSSHYAKPSLSKHLKGRFRAALLSVRKYHFFGQYA